MFNTLCQRVINTWFLDIGSFSMEINKVFSESRRILNVLEISH